MAINEDILRAAAAAKSGARFGKKSGGSNIMAVMQRIAEEAKRRAAANTQAYQPSGYTGGSTGGGGAVAAPVSTLASLPQSPLLTDLINKGLIKEGMPPEQALAILQLGQMRGGTAIDVEALMNQIKADYENYTGDILTAGQDWMKNLYGTAYDPNDPNAALFAKDPIFSSYAGGLTQMDETADQNLATDLAWFEKAQAADQAYYDQMMAGIASGAIAAGPVASGGGGGGGGGYGGGRGYGRGGGGSGSGDGELGYGDTKTVVTGREGISESNDLQSTAYHPNWANNLIALANGDPEKEEFYYRIIDLAGGRPQNLAKAIQVEKDAASAIIGKNADITTENDMFWDALINGGFDVAQEGYLNRTGQELDYSPTALEYGTDEQGNKILKGQTWDEGYDVLRAIEGATPYQEVPGTPQFEEDEAFENILRQAFDPTGGRVIDAATVNNMLANMGMKNDVNIGGQSILPQPPQPPGPPGTYETDFGGSDFPATTGNSALDIAASSGSPFAPNFSLPTNTPNSRELLEILGQKPTPPPSSAVIPGIPPTASIQDTAVTPGGTATQTDEGIFLVPPGQQQRSQPNMNQLLKILGQTSTNPYEAEFGGPDFPSSGQPQVPSGMEIDPVTGEFQPTEAGRNAYEEAMGIPSSAPGTTPTGSPQLGEAIGLMGISPVVQALASARLTQNAPAQDEPGPPPENPVLSNILSTLYNTVVNAANTGAGEAIPRTNWNDIFAGGEIRPDLQTPIQDWSLLTAANELEEDPYFGRAGSAEEAEAYAESHRVPGKHFRVPILEDKVATAQQIYDWLSGDFESQNRLGNEQWNMAPTKATNTIGTDASLTTSGTATSYEDLAAGSTEVGLPKYEDDPVLYDILAPEASLDFGSGALPEDTIDYDDSTFSMGFTGGPNMRTGPVSSALMNAAISRLAAPEAPTAPAGISGFRTPTTRTTTSTTPTTNKPARKTALKDYLNKPARTTKKKKKSGSGRKMYAV